MDDAAGLEMTDSKNRGRRKLKDEGFVRDITTEKLPVRMLGDKTTDIMDSEMWRQVKFDELNVESLT